MTQHQSYGRNGNDKQDSSITQSARDSLHAAGDDVSEITQAAREEAKRLAATAKEQVQRFATGQKRNTADTIEDVAHMLREAGENFPDKRNLKGIIDQAASTLEDVSHSVRSKSFSDIYEDAESFARRRPVATAMGAAAVGFLVARFLKSSSTKSRRYVARSYDGQRGTRGEYGDGSYRENW